MADTKYLNYGDLQIELLALLNNLSNNINKYVLKLPWSNKKKERFLLAYQDIMSRGIMGASNNTGEWEINVGGDTMPTMSKKDREIYEEAAYFIQLLMANLPTKANEELDKKSELPVLDNDTFINDFRKRISSDDRGGRPFFIDDEWNNLDKRNEKGERGRIERTKKLLKYLNSYKNNFDSSKFNFEGSPFKDEADFKTRLDNAITALQSPQLDDDNEALNRLGLNPKDWFNNGTGDPYTADVEFTKLYGPTGSYGLYYNEYLPSIRKAKADSIVNKRASEIKQQLQLTLQYGIRSTRPLTNLVTRRALADKYGNLDTLAALLGDYGNKLDLLNPNELDEVISALSYGATLPISDDEWNILKSNKAYANSNRNRFKKHPGVNNLIYDSATKRVILIYESLGADYLAGLDSKSLEKSYLESSLPGLTGAETKELIAIGLDIGSIVDPEPITAATMGAGAAGLRHMAKNETPGHEWTFWEGVGLGIDYLTGVVGAIPIGGDLVLAGKTLIQGSKVLPIILKSLRYLMRAGSWKDIYDGALSNEGRQTVDKILNGEDLSVQDWRHIGEVIRGIAGHHVLNKSNRAFKKTAELEGFLTEASSNLSKKLGSNELWRNTGFASSKIKTLNEASSLKLTRKKEDGTVETREEPLKPGEKEKLEEAFRKVKPSERTAEAKRILGNDRVGDFEVFTEGGWRAKARNWNLYSRKTKDSFESKTENLPNRGVANLTRLNGWLNNRGYLSRVMYGTDELLKNIAKTLSPAGSVETISGTVKLFNERNIPPIKKPSELQISNMKQLEKAKLDSKNNKIPKDVKFRREAIEIYKNISKDKFSNNEVVPGVSSVDGTPLQVIKNADGTFSLLNNGTTIKLANLLSLLKAVRDLIKNSKLSSHARGKLLHEFSSNGWLKQGGRIDKLKIQIYKKYIQK